MKIEDLKYIADVEMMRMGFLSKGIRLEIVYHARKGYKFDITCSTDDATLIGAALQRTGDRSNMKMQKTDIANRKHLSFNESCA